MLSKNRKQCHDLKIACGVKGWLKNVCVPILTVSSVPVSSSIMFCTIGSFNTSGKNMETVCSDNSDHWMIHMFTFMIHI